MLSEDGGFLRILFVLSEDGGFFENFVRVV